jgi:phosphoribosylglycinamide formyltransferase 1
MRLAVLVSGRGSNLEAVLDAVASGELAGVDPRLVISNRREVRALEVAARHAVPTRVLRRFDFNGDPGARDRAIGRTLAAASIDLALLAGYDQVLHPPYFAAYGGLTINIHPALLPRHGGRGMVGCDVHRSVIAAGDTESGATVHVVTPEIDAGPILSQARVAVMEGDDVRSLAARVLAAEHRLVVATLADLAAKGSAGMASATITAASAAPPGAGSPHQRPVAHA